MSHTLTPAPYSNAMRLGQGFNSYTQEICLDRAVLLDEEDESVHAQRTAALLLSKSKATQAKEGGELSTASQQTVASSDGIDNITPESATDAALDYGEKERAAVLGAPVDAGDLEVQPWVRPQIVTYSSHFVDKLSDVTDAMNISGSISIKTAQIGGKANGSYIDSDKFKQSDINFHLHVKVVNQIHLAPNYRIFNKLGSMDPAKFNEVYGDCFISGWEEGGELNAVISMKVKDKAKIWELKAGLEAELTTPSVAGKLEAQVELTKNKLAKETETTITVNWSGGGSIKHPRDDWNIASLKAAAAAFPDLVAITPQRTHAILSKYTTLKTFHDAYPHISPLKYENAGIYTNSLMDHYMDYKSIWKQISNATYDLEGNRATIEMARPAEDIYRLAQIKRLPTEQIVDKQFALEDNKQKNSKIQNHQLNLTALKTQNPGELSDNTVLKFEAFRPSFAGLIEARQVCRFEMAKIVNEVDLISKNPELASDTRRDSFFLNPLVFKQLLPIVRSLSPENSALGIKDPNAALILGYIPPPDDDSERPHLLKAHGDPQVSNHVLAQSIKELSYKAGDYLMEGCSGETGPVHTQDVLFNDLETLDATSRPSAVSVWIINEIVVGVKTLYSNGVERSHGSCNDDPTKTLTLDDNGSEAIVEASFKEGKVGSGNKCISSVSFATSICNLFDTATNLNSKPGASWTRPDENPWSFRGFFGFVHKDPEVTEKEDAVHQQREDERKEKQKKEGEVLSEEATRREEENKPFQDESTKSSESDSATKNASNPNNYVDSKKSVVPSDLDGKVYFVSLGIVWGKDSFVPVPRTKMTYPIAKSFMNLHQLQQQRLNRVVNNSKGDFKTQFFFGGSVTTRSNSTCQVFSALDDIDIHWKITKIAFYVRDKALSGLRVTYMNGRELLHGNVKEGTTMIWECEPGADLHVAKITAGKVAENETAYVDTVEFIRAGKEGHMPSWPLDLATTRFLGVGDKRVALQTSEIVESAPRIGRKQWSIRGFYGEFDDHIITEMGVIWGRG